MRDPIREFQTYEASPIREALVRHSAVCIPLIETAPGEYDVLYTVRSSKIDTQPGDVCFPGGMMEEGETREEAAVREIMEELLIRREQVELLGPSDIYSIAALRVYPYVCILKEYEDTFSTDEVAEVFRIPLKALLAMEPDRYEALWKVDLPENFPYEKIQGGRNYRWRERKEELLFYQYRGRIVWGLTARVTHAFLEVWRKLAEEES